MDNLYLFIIVVLVVFFIFLKSPAGKGVLGELYVKLMLGRNKKGKKYIVNNLTLLDKNNMSHQIDHVLINKNGVFVIETKNYSGRVYGKDNQLEWTQVLAYGRVKNKFYNPVKQNKTHVFHLKPHLPSNIPIYSVIVFVKNNIDYIESDSVVGFSGLRKFIKRRKEFKMGREDIDSLYNIINNLKSKNKVSKRKHVKNIKTMLNNIDDNICPRCNSKLLLRNGKNGKFYGCSNYPKCTFTKKI